MMYLGMLNTLKNLYQLSREFVNVLVDLLDKSWLFKMYLLELFQYKKI